jgi:hypothetical protein
MAEHKACAMARRQDVITTLTTRRAHKRLPRQEATHRMMSMLSELWAFMRVRKKWWLGPIVLVLVLFGALIVLTQGSAVAPFIYTIF